MKMSKWFFVMVLIAILAVSSNVFSQESEIRKNFLDAFDQKDKARMVEIVEKNKKAIPAEVDGLLGKVVFLEKSTDKDGKIRNVFSPDNVIIKQGEKVRWVNEDKYKHLFASTMQFLGGMGGISSPDVEPGESWEYKFEKPGEYFYMCFIHRGMLGKVTVMGEVAEDVKESATEAVKEEATEEGSHIFVAETMSKMYKDVTGDFEPMKKVKRRAFDVRLTSPVQSQLTDDGVHIITIPESAEAEIKHEVKEKEESAPFMLR